MTTAILERPSTSTAALVRARIERGGERYWRLSDFSGHSPTAVVTALSRLAREGVLQRVRKGLYYHPRTTTFGDSKPTATAVAGHSLRAPIYPAGQTAANALGFSTQNPALAEYATTAHDPPSVLGNSHVYTRRPKSRERLSSEEGALLELLRERARSSDLSDRETAKRLLRLLREPGRFERLARTAFDEPPRVRAMLGALGEELGTDAKLLVRLRKTLNPLSRFDFGKLRALKYAEKWQAK